MKSNKILFFVIVLAACLTQLASDIYTPSLPAIASDLNSSINLVQWSLAIYLIGVAVSQLIYGPLSEGFGRKIPLSIGFIIMLIGSLVCTLAPNVNTLILGRLIQGCGAGAGAALWRTIFRDVYSGEDLSKYGSYLVIFIMFIVPAAPALGGYLQEYLGWRANFTFVCFYTVVTLLLVIFALPESSKYHHRERLKISFISSTFKRMLTHRLFMSITFCSFLSYGAFFAWFTAGPVILIKNLGLSPVTFGWITFLGGGSAYVLAGQVNGLLVKKLGIPNMLRMGWSIMILSGLLLLLGYGFIGMNVWTIVIPVLIFYFGSTLIWPNAVATAFTPFGDIAGYAGALYGSLQIAGGAVLGALIAYLPDSDPIPLALTFLINSILAWIIFEQIPRSN